MTNAEAYEKVVALLMKAELAARNHEFATCGTYAEQAKTIAWDHQDEVDR